MFLSHLLGISSVGSVSLFLMSDFLFKAKVTCLLSVL